MKYRVVLQPEAKLDLIEAVEYLWPQAPQGAERWMLGLLNAINRCRPIHNNVRLPPKLSFYRALYANGSIEPRAA